jgi:DNA-damage-inducible protein D
MLDKLSIKNQNTDFESIKKIDENGVEYWTARELMSLLDYTEWRNFEEVIQKAEKACINSRELPQDHFVEVNKMIKLAKNAVRNIKDYHLDRYACYLIAQNGDPKKKQIALAQTYFAIQTRAQEIQQNLDENEKRLKIREEVTRENKKLFSTARLSGVSNFGKFNDAGYKGLYTIPLSEIEKKKKIKKGELLDRAGSEELGANLFRITQTEAKLKRENIRGDIKAEQTHFEIGRKVRQTIKEIGGEMPENLKTEKHIKEIKKDKKLLKNSKTIK